MPVTNAQEIGTWQHFTLIFGYLRVFRGKLRLEPFQITLKKGYNPECYNLTMAFMRLFSRKPPPSGRSFARFDHPLRGRTVLQVVPALDSGGVERTAVDVAAGLASVGARALVASTGGRMVGELQARGGVFIPFPAATKNPLLILRNASLLAGLIRDEGVDLVHARSRAPAWSSLIAARARDVPFVTTYAGAYNAQNSLKNLYNSVMARGDTVIANSHFTAHLIVSQHRSAQARLRVIPRGVDLSRFTPELVDPARIAQLRKSWSVDSDVRIVLLAGRITAWKGTMVLVDAAARLRANGLQDVVFVLAGDVQGDGHFARAVDERILSHGLQGIVKRVGHCADMPAAFLTSSLAVMPSTEPEAFGRVAVEAQAMGCPVVVSDHGAVAETVLAPPEVSGEYRTGWRVAPRNGAALAEAIEIALSLGASARSALGERARKHVETHFSLEGMITQTLDVYAALLCH
jgi:glycosyltransferase involved in cell wall biosynthesis